MATGVPGFPRNPFEPDHPWWTTRPSSLGDSGAGRLPHNPRSWQGLMHSLGHTLPFHLRRAERNRRRIMRAIR